MITRAEVNEAIRSVGAKATTCSVMDKTPVTITAGELYVLLEAAKVARYTDMDLLGDDDLGDDLEMP